IYVGPLQGIRRRRHGVISAAVSPAGTGCRSRHGCPWASAQETFGPDLTVQVN
ncbi:hypothetical protein COCCADRAFT_81392, partial [Bipolaris zeicola 26-R-13]